MWCVMCHVQCVMCDVRCDVGWCVICDSALWMKGAKKHVMRNVWMPFRHEQQDDSSATSLSKSARDVICRVAFEAGARGSFLAAEEKNLQQPYIHIWIFPIYILFPHMTPTYHPIWEHIIPTHDTHMTPLNFPTHDPTIIPTHYSHTLFPHIIPTHYSHTLFPHIIPTHYSHTLFHIFPHLRALFTHRHPSNPPIPFLPISINNSFTFCAVFAEVSKYNNPLSAA
jgi:hypothetical protein